MAEQVQSGPQQSRARRFLGAGKRTLDGEDRSERIKTGRKGTPFRAFSPTIKPEFPDSEARQNGQKKNLIGHLTHYRAVVSSSLQVLPHVIRNLPTGCEPNTWFGFHVSNQLVEIRDS